MIYLGKNAVGISDTVSIVPIDDTAGIGDTTKVWSADKTAMETTELKSALNSVEDELFDEETVELLQANIISFINHYTDKITDNGDGTYTINTGTWGTLEFGNQYLTAGKYRLFGSPYGFSYIAVSQNGWQDPVVSNDTNDYKEVEISVSGDYYIGHRLSSIQSEAFTITPSLLTKCITHKMDEIANEKENLIENTPVNGTTISLNAITVNDDGTITHGTTDYGTIMFANQIVLKPGTYYLFGIDYFKGFGFISEQLVTQNKGQALFYNNSVIPKACTIDTEKTVYVGYRSEAAPSKPFTFRPQLLIEKNKFVSSEELEELEEDLGAVNETANTALSIGNSLSERFNITFVEIDGYNLYPNGAGELVGPVQNADRGYTQIDVILSMSIKVVPLTNEKVTVYERNRETRKWYSKEDVWHSGTYCYTFDSTSDLYFIELDINNVTIPSGTNSIVVTSLSVQQRPILRTNKSYLFERYKEQATVFRRQTTSSEGNGIVAFKAMLISDVHMESDRMQNVVNLVNEWGTSYFDALINCGDTVTYGSENPAWYYTMTADLAVPSLNTIGNHDTWDHTQVQTYENIIAPLASQAGIVQPENASTLGLCYYYHDFTKVRVIVVDCMNWDTDQANWFESVLDDAKENDLYVIACSHYQFSESIETHIPCLWGIRAEATQYLNTQAAEKVYSFITGGGTFLCWLTGHEHGDNLHVLQSHGNQLVISLPTLTQRACTLWPNSDKEAYNYDVMTYFAVDDRLKLLKLLRFGADIDLYGVKKAGVVLNYETGTLVAAY